LAQYVSVSLTNLSCMLTFDQVFYGRYVKRLSNKTQEALGDMTKVGKIIVVTIIKVFTDSSVGRPGSVSRPSYSTSLQCGSTRREEIFPAG